MSESNSNSSAGEAQEKQQQKTSTDGAEESAVLPTLAVEVPREEWPSLPQFKKIEENVILCKDAESKESKSIQCDCKHSSKELKRGKGCGEECLNRLLMMECRGGCPSGKYCTNKRFQKREYAEIELFYTGAKGWGMRAKQDITQGQFIIEYVGEVIGSREMQRRIRRYGHDPNHKHHYLMALRSGTVIDATTHGNNARFINHSCDPNATTQKWTVGRQLRIGFFALRVIKSGEEVVFNYQFERYGKRAQKCLCGSANCTGYIGATGREDSGVDSAGEEGEGGAAAVAETDFSSSESELGEALEGIDLAASVLQPAKVQPMKRKKGRPPKHLAKFDRKTDKQHPKRAVALRPERISDPTLRETAEVSEILAKGPLRNREKVLEFNRLMVRVDQTESRRRMVDFLLAIEDPNILRLFVAHQGLALIRIWFVLPPFDLPALQLQSQIARLLLRLPVTNKNQVDEVCIMSTLNQMINMELPDKLVISEMVNQMADFVAEEVDGPTAIAKAEPDPAVCEFEELRLLAEQLTDKWANLVNSDFRIPKKLSKTVSKLVTRGMAVLQNNKQNKRFVPKCKMSNDGFTNPSNNEFNDQFGPNGEEPMNENDRDWQYRRFRNHFERRIRRRGGQPFFYHQQNANFNGGRENMMHLGGQLYNDPEFEPPPCFFNAPPRLPKLFPDALPYAAAPNSPSVLPHPNMAHPMASHFYPTPSPMHPYCLPPVPSPYHHHHLYYAQNGVGSLMPIPVSAPQPLPPPPPPPPPPERWIPEDEQLEMELDNGSDMDEDSSNGINTQQCPSTSSSCSNINKLGIKKEEPSAVVESDAIEKGGEKENATATGTAAKDTRKKERQQKREKQKSAKDLIKESLQRRIQSLKAQLGTKATPPIWGPAEPTDHRTAFSGVKAERRWSRSRSPSPGSAGSRSRPSSTTPDSALKNRSRRSSPYKEQKKDEERRAHREDKGGAEQHDEERDKQQQHRRRRNERERRRSGPGEGGGDRSHGRKDNRMSLSPDRTGGTDPYIDRRGGGRRRSSPGRRVGRFAGRSRIAMNNKRFFERRNRGRWPRKMNCDSTNTIPRRRGGTYDRIRAQLAEQAYKHQMQDKKEETKLSPEEELQKQQDLNSKKAVINAYAEKLKGLIQTDKDSTAKLNNALTEMNIASKNRNYRQISLRQRSASTSSTSSTSSTVSSTSTTSSGSSSTTSSSSSSSTSTDSQEKNDNTQRTTGRSSPKGVEPPKQPIMLKRMIGANGTVKNGQHVSTVQVENRVSQKVTKILPLESAQTKKGRFVAAFKIAPTAAHLPFANCGTKSAAVAKAFGNSDGGEDGEEETLPKNSYNKVEEKPNQKLQKQFTNDKTEDHSSPTTMAYPSKVEEMKETSEDFEKRAKQTETKEEPKEEERMVKREKKKKRKEHSESNHEKEEQKERDGEDEDDNLQPPCFSLEILSDPGRMDAYIHQLKEFVYNVETLRRDMHGPPPLPSSMAAALRHHTNVLSPIPSSTSSSLLSSIGTSQQQNQHLSAIAIKELKLPIGNSKAKTAEVKGEKQQPKQTVRQENTNRGKGTETAAPTRTTAKRERMEDEDFPSPSTSKVQPVLAKRLRVGSVERKDGQRQHAHEIRMHIDELQGVHSSVSVQASTPPEDPRTNNADTPNAPPSSSVSVQQQQQPQSHLSLSSTVTTVVLSEPLLSSSTVGRRSTTVMTTVVDPSLGSTSHQQHGPNMAGTKQHPPTAGDNKKGAGGAKANPFRNHPSLLNSLTTDSDAHHLLMENGNAATNESCADVADTEPNDEVFAILNETTSTTEENELGEGLSANNGASSVATVGEEAASASTTNASTFATAPLMSKSGIWLGARDTDGALYFYHRDTREARWDLPEGEELLVIDKSNVGAGAMATSPNAELMGIERQVRRAEFKRHVSALVAKCIDPYRRRFFHANGEYANFLRKITHKVLDNQPKSGNVELLFNEQVQKNTQRLVDEYIRHFKNRESHQLLHHRTDSQGLSPK
ncbi:hypothetical protein niasHT_004717 [Heterodera trifolii]|uniref:Histone-lysine N-methyltransferase CG1716 n=1 Tax=Heterodera trifolii TaxID=157864 RepID=A0ABD2M9D5_9BILA